VVNGNSVSVWAYADGDEPSLNANHTFTTDNVSNPIASLIFSAGTNDSSAVIIDEFYYNISPSPDVLHVATTGSDQTGDGSADNPFATIQAGIDASNNDDVTVLVAAGTYVENINYNGKNIAVIGEDRETTIIDGGQNGGVITFSSGEDSTTVLNGFTIQNGFKQETGNSVFPDDYSGAGIFIGYNSHPKIMNCKIINNTSADEGGGIIYYFTVHNFRMRIVTNKYTCP
jgi:hypothetical protein